MVESEYKASLLFDLDGTLLEGPTTDFSVAVGGVIAQLREIVNLRISDEAVEELEIRRHTGRGLRPGVEQMLIEVNKLKAGSDSKIDILVATGRREERLGEITEKELDHLGVLDEFSELYLRQGDVSPTEWKLEQVKARLDEGDSHVLLVENDPFTAYEVAVYALEHGLLASVFLCETIETREIFLRMRGMSRKKLEEAGVVLFEDFENLPEMFRERIVGLRKQRKM